MQLWRVIQNSEDPCQGRVVGPSFDVPCALGRTGVIDAADKREGDGKTPLGTYPFRRIFYRADRMPAPDTELTVIPISEVHGWCDDPASEQYNQLVQLPFAASHEKMWREDALYDLVLVIGHNDDPLKLGMGSAIFVHVAKEGFLPTEGCVALEKPALLKLLGAIKAEDQLQIG